MFCCVKKRSDIQLNCHHSEHDLLDVKHEIYWWCRKNHWRTHILCCGVSAVSRSTLPATLLLTMLYSRCVRCAFGCDLLSLSHSQSLSLSQSIPLFRFRLFAACNRTICTPQMPLHAINDVLINSLRRWLTRITLEKKCFICFRFFFSLRISLPLLFCAKFDCAKKTCVATGIDLMNKMQLLVFLPRF